MALLRRDPQAKFVAAARRAIGQLGVSGAVEFDEELFAFRLDGDRLIMLGNIFGRYQSLAPKEAESYLTIALAALLQEANTPKTFDEANDRLLPGVRDRTFIESARLMAQLQDNPMVPIPHRALGSTMVALLVIDSPTSIMTVNEEHLTDWGVGFDQAMAVASENLIPRSTDATWGRVVDGVYASMWNDDYDASRLLLADVVDEVGRDLGISGDPVVFVPHRNLLILTGSENPSGLSAAMELTEDNLDQPSQISARPLIRHDGEWEDFVVTDDHPAAFGLQRLRQADLALAYGAVTPLIQQVVGDEVFAANSILAEKDGVFVTTTSWSEGAPAVIPQTDRILFFRSQEETWLVAWEDAVAAVGDLLQETDFHPVRFLVESFPTGEQLAAMPRIEN